MTLGPALLVLAWLDRRDLSRSNPLIVFGRVPLFYFVLHFFLAHAVAVVMAVFTHGSAAWSFMFQPVPSMGGPAHAFPAALVRLVGHLRYLGRHRRDPVSDMRATRAVEGASSRVVGFLHLNTPHLGTTPLGTGTPAPTPKHPTHPSAPRHPVPVPIRSPREISK